MRAPHGRRQHFVSPGGLSRADRAAHDREEVAIDFLRRYACLVTTATVAPQLHRGSLSSLLRNQWRRSYRPARVDDQRRSASATCTRYSFARRPARRSYEPIRRAIRVARVRAVASSSRATRQSSAFSDRPSFCIRSRPVRSREKRYPSAACRSTVSRSSRRRRSSGLPGMSSAGTKNAAAAARYSCTARPAPARFPRRCSKPARSIR